MVPGMGGPPFSMGRWAERISVNAKSPYRSLRRSSTTTILDSSTPAPRATLAVDSEANEATTSVR